MKKHLSVVPPCASSKRIIPFTPKACATEEDTLVDIRHSVRNELAVLRKTCDIIFMVGLTIFLGSVLAALLIAQFFGVFTALYVCAAACVILLVCVFVAVHFFTIAENIRDEINKINSVKEN